MFYIEVNNKLNLNSFFLLNIITNTLFYIYILYTLTLYYSVSIHFCSFEIFVNA